jgi:hypothetical protein
MRNSFFYSAIVLLFSSLLSAAVQANWVLDPEQSSLHFISVKNNSVGEVHHFKKLKGSLSENGEVQVDIPLASVETGIAIRNERLKTLLFNLTSIPSSSMRMARITASIDKGIIHSLIQGDTLTTNISFVLEMNGNSHDYQALISLSKLKNGDLLATTTSPVLLNATDFDLVAGIEKLREIAGLNSIVTTIPITASWVFSPVKE